MFRPLAYDAKKAAKALCLTEAEFLALVRAGALPTGIMLGKEERWPLSDLEAVLSGSTIDEDFEI